jgi:hypothetical protein
MADRVFAIKINADGTVAVQSFNKVGAAGKKMEQDISSGASGIKASLNSLGSFASSIMPIISRFSVATPFVALEESIRRTANAGEELLKLSHQIGMPVEELSGLKYAAELSETGIEELTGSVGLLSKNLHTIDDESKLSNRAIQALGISVKDTSGHIRGTHDILIDLADRFSNMKDGTEKTAFAMEIFGRSGKNMIPLLNEGSASIREMEREAKSLGITFTEESAKAADKFNDNLTRLKSSVMGLTYKIGNELIPVLNDLFSTLTPKGRVTLELDNLELKITHLKSLLEGGSIGKNLQRFLYVGDIGKDLAEAEKKRLEILQKFFTHNEPGHFELTGQAPPFLPDVNKADEIKNKIRELSNAVEDFDTQLADMNPTLSATDRQFMKWEDSADKLIRTIEQAAGVPQAIKDNLIDQDLQTWGKGFENIWIKELEKSNDAAAKAYGEAYDNSKKLEEDITEATSSELGKRLLAVEKWYEEEMRLNFLGATSYGEYKELQIKIEDTADKMRLDNANEYYRQVEDLELQHQLAVIDLKEKTFQISESEAVQEKIDNYNQYLENLNEEYKLTIGIKDKYEERMQILIKIDDIQGKITDNLQRQKELTGTFEQGISEGIESYFRELDPVFKQGFDLAKDSLKSLQDTVSSFSFDAMQGKLKSFSDYWMMLLSSIEKKLADILAQWMFFGESRGGGGGGGGGLFGLISGLFSGGGGNTIPLSENIGMGTGLAGHSGGYVTSYGIIPEFHSGGLNPDEIFAKLKKKEYVVSEKGVRAAGVSYLNQINRGEIQIERQGSPIIVNMNVYAMDAQSFRGYVIQNKKAIADAIMIAGSNNHPVRRS